MDKITDTSGGHSDICHHKSRSTGHSGGHCKGRELEEGECESNSSHCGNDSVHKSGVSGMTPDTSLLQAIYSKYGDITKGCNFKSETFKKSCLRGICEVIHKLRDTSIDDMNSEDFTELFSLTNDAECLNLDVKWLHQRLVEVQEAVRSRDMLHEMEDDQRATTLQGEIFWKRIQTNKIEIAKIEHDIKMLTEEHARVKSRHDEVKALTEDIKSSYHSSPKFLIDWLL